MSQTTELATPITIKKRSPWVVLIFTLITLGYYGIYWAVVTNKSLRGKTLADKPSWMWLLLPAILVPVASVITFIIVIVAYFSNEIATDTVTVIFNTMTVAQVVLFFALTLPWIVPFTKLIQTKTGLNRWWTLVAYFFVGPLVAVPVQNRINRLPKRLGRPLVATIVFIVLTLGIGTLNVYSALDNARTLPQAREMFQSMGTQMGEYFDCVYSAELKFPEGERGPHAKAYQKAIALCDKNYQDWADSLDY